MFSNLFQFNKKEAINHKFDLEKAFQEILYSIERRVNEGSCWIIELIDSQYTNIPTFRPLSGTFFLQKITCWIKKF